MIQTIEQYAEATRRVEQQLCSMIGSEKEKRQALLNQDMTRLEALLQAQQAMVMKLESLESRRCEAQKAAGFENKKASEILQAVGAEERALLEPLFCEIRETAEQYSELNRISLDIANTELRMINQIAQSSGEEGSGVYRNDGKKQNAGNGTAFTEKV